MVAAGSGVRLGGAEPKALRTVGGIPLVRHAVDAMARAGATRVVVAVPAGYDDDFTAALAGTDVPCRLLVGGAERQESVRLGLAELDRLAVPDRAGAGGVDPVVLIHDAARGLMPAAVARAVVAAVRGGAAAVVPAQPVSDSIRRVDAAGSATVDRTTLRIVQTPQGFRLSVLLAAHETLRRSGARVTDDAAVAEAAGHRVELVPGSPDGLKVTVPADLLVAESVWAGRGERR